jgi:hypothetical protein
MLAKKYGLSPKRYDRCTTRRREVSSEKEKLAVFLPDVEWGIVVGPGTAFMAFVEVHLHPEQIV